MKGTAVTEALNLVEDDLIPLMLAELHANVPEADRPMSLMDLSDEQIGRARRAVRAVVLGACLSKPAGRWPSLAALEAALASGMEAREGRDAAERLDGEAATARSDAQEQPLEPKD